jgi:hypothetical protein
MPAAHSRPFHEIHLHTDIGVCWCSPDLLGICPSCQGDAEDSEGCWQCKGRGITDVVVETATLVIHHPFAPVWEDADHE